MKIKNAMIDTETLAVDWNAVVLTIGAVKFNPFTNEVTDKLHIRLDTESQTNKGRTICEDTLAWWGRQADSVKADAFSEDPDFFTFQKSLEANATILTGTDTVVMEPENFGNLF